MMTPLWLRGFAAPLLVVVLSSLMWLERGPGAACVVLAVGFLAVVAWHLWQLQKLTQWAAGPIDSQVPEGRGIWALAYTALYRRVRLRSARQRDLRLGNGFVDPVVLRIRR